MKQKEYNEYLKSEYNGGDAYGMGYYYIHFYLEGNETKKKEYANKILGILNDMEIFPPNIMRDISKNIYAMNFTEFTYYMGIDTSDLEYIDIMYLDNIHGGDEND